jgi:hypothetical protein
MDMAALQEKLNKQVEEAAAQKEVARRTRCEIDAMRNKCEMK